MVGPRLKVFSVCSGLGHVQRGFETFAQDVYEALAPLPELEMTIVPAGALTVKRDSRVARALRRDPYRLEARTYALSLIPLLLRRRPDVVIYSDWPVGQALGRIRKALRLDFKLLLSNGAAGWPPFPPADLIQQPTPDLLRVAIDGGDPPEHNTQVPLGLAMEERWEPPTGAERAALGLPDGRQVVLSVAAINSWSKRIDYLIDEVASLPEPRPFLALIGQFEDETPALLERAREKLGPEGFIAKTVPKHEVRDWYRAADVFVLASTTEGFGLVLLEAMAEGLPCIAHDYPTPQYILGPHGLLADIRETGAVARMLGGVEGDPRARRQYVWENFSWHALRPAYLDMIRACAAS